MKKALASVVAIAMTLAVTASAKSTTLLFNRPQFQPHQYTCDINVNGVQGKNDEVLEVEKVLLTVPLVYKGSVALTIDSLNNDGTEAWNICEIEDPDVAKCKVNKDKEIHCCYKIDTTKLTVPVFMTICQPCIDCFPCYALEKEQSDVPIAFVDDKFYCEAQPGKITKWNLYYVFQNKKAKWTEIDKFNLLEDDYNATFFTGKPSTKPGFMYIGGYGDLFLTGKKSDYSFKYTVAYIDATGNWEGAGKTKSETAYIKSLAAMSGATTISGINAELNDNCVDPWDADVSEKIAASFKLTRDASLTKKAITATFSTVFAKAGKNWEDCDVDTPASYCEEYFMAEAGDNFDDYLDGQYNKKGWDYELLDYNYVEDELLEPSEDSEQEAAPTPKE